MVRRPYVMAKMTRLVVANSTIKNDIKRPCTPTNSSASIVPGSRTMFSIHEETAEPGVLEPPLQRIQSKIGQATNERVRRIHLEFRVCIFTGVQGSSEFCFFFLFSFFLLSLSFFLQIQLGNVPTSWPRQRTEAKGWRSGWRAGRVRRRFRRRWREPLRP